MTPTRRRANLSVVAVAAVTVVSGGGHTAAAQDPGKDIFTSAEPPCATCHVLADAGANGRIGPNLDDLKPTEEQVRAAVQVGPGAMPEYENFTDAEISALASYVARVAGGGA